MLTPRGQRQARANIEHKQLALARHEDAAKERASWRRIEARVKALRRLATSGDNAEERGAQRG